VTEPWLVVMGAGVLGLALGSFLNVCALRWAQDQSVIKPRSACPGCGEAIAWFDNIPVLSWIVLRGRCRRCGEGISIQYPLVELATGLIWAGMFWAVGMEMEALRGAVFLTLLLGIAVADARFYIIPDQFSVGGAVLGFAFSFATPAITWQSSLMGALAGFFLLWFVAWAGEKAFKKEAMGGGDIKMMAMIGAFLGAWGMALSLFLGAVLGAVIFGPISLKTGKLVPFGIFLAAGAAVAFVFGDAIIDWYWGWAFPTG
jgi:leader peptidase (prepilin peptidase) / N-methyltransferase